MRDAPAADDVPEMLEREVRAYFEFVAGAETERAVRARTFHVLRTFDEADFGRVFEAFERADATASVAFLGRDAADQAPVIEAADDRGFEVACHGHRHVRFGDLSYDRAHADLSAAVEAIEGESGVRPTGFFAPFKAVSEGTLQAAADLDFEWVLGQPSGEDPGDVPVVDSVSPHDTRLLEGGTPPGETFDQLGEAAVPGSTFLFHPNMIEYYRARGEFEAWIEAVGPTSVGAQVAGEEGVGVVLDCLRPLRLS